jgi:hypothetical protein
MKLRVPLSDSVRRCLALDYIRRCTAAVAAGYRATCLHLTTQFSGGALSYVTRHLISQQGQ